MTQPKMNPEVKEKWLTALRSGEYKQTKGTLRDDKGYCCLGVLCDVARKEGVIPNPVKYKDSEGDTKYFYGKGPVPKTDSDYYGTHRSSATLPAVVLEWAGLVSDNPYIGSTNASMHNDVAKRDFNEIADLIEQYL